MILSARTYGMALLSGAVLLSGCMPAYRAAPEQAQVTTPSGWIGTSSEGTVVDSAWWKAFDDPGLSAAVEAALARNNDILSAATRIEQARAAGQAVTADEVRTMDLKPQADAGNLDLKNFRNGVLANGQVDGKQIGIPVGANAMALVIDLNAFKKAGVKLVSTEFFDRGQSDYRPLLTRLKRSNPESLLMVMPDRGTSRAVSSSVKARSAIRTSGTLVCWGTNLNGEGSPPTGTFTALSTGYNYSCAIRVGGTLACWGENDAGETAPPLIEETIGANFERTVASYGETGDGGSTPLGLHVDVHDLGAETPERGGHLGAGGSRADDGARQDAAVTLDETTQRATLTLPSVVPAGPAVVSLRFRGVLNDKLRGFYRSTYVDEAGAQRAGLP